SVDDVLRVCARWEVNATAIGEVTDSGRMRVFSGESLVGDVPVASLVDECPVYELAPSAPARPIYPASPRAVAEDLEPAELLVALIGSANLASRRPVFEQYDCVVGSRTVRRPEQADAAVLVLDQTGAGGVSIAVSIDGNGRRVAADPYRGAVEAVLEC